MCVVSMGKNKIVADETEIRSTGRLADISLFRRQFIGGEVVQCHAIPGKDVVLGETLGSLIDGDANVSRRQRRENRGLLVENFPRQVLRLGQLIRELASK